MPADPSSEPLLGELCVLLFLSDPSLSLESCFWEDCLEFWGSELPSDPSWPSPESDCPSLESDWSCSSSPSCCSSGGGGGNLK